MVRSGTAFALIVSMFSSVSMAGPPVPAFTAAKSVTLLKFEQTETGIAEEEPLLAGSPQGTLYLLLPHTRSLFRSDDRGANWRTLFDTRSGLGNAADSGTADGAIADTGLGVVHWLGMLGSTPVPYQRSTDRGVHWSAPVPLSTVTNADRQWIVGDRAGNLVADWADKTTGLVMYRHSHDNGLTWSSEQPITTLSAYAGAPARGSLDGEFFVPMTTYTGADSPCIKVARTRDGGRTWKLSTCIRYVGGLMGSNAVPGPVVINFTFLAADDADNLYLVYAIPSLTGVVSSPLAPAAVYMSRSLDGGDTWQPEIRISGAFHNAVYGWPVAGARGHVAIAYYEDNAGLSREVPSVWSTRLAYSEDADTLQPHFVAGVADAQTHVGTICNECGEFARLDHLGIAALPDGQVAIAWERDGPVNPSNLLVVTSRTTNLHLR